MSAPDSSESEASGRRRPCGRLAAGLAAAAILATAPFSPAAAQNELATLVLHAVPFQARNDCATPQRAGFDCRARAANVSVAASSDIDVYLYVFGYDNVAGVQCKFEWSPDWTFYGWRSSCRAHQLAAVQPEPGGQRNLATVFDPLSPADGLAPVGWLQMTAGVAGCLTIGESDFPDGTHVATGGTSSSATAIPPAHRGSVCVGTRGTDGCTAAGDLPDSSWGSIKASFQN